MRDNNSKKLSLNVETMRELTTEETDQVNGGTIGTIVIVVTFTVTTLTETCKRSTSNSTSLVN